MARNVDADTEHSGDENTDHIFEDLQFVTHSVTIESEALNNQNTTSQINEEGIVGIDSIEEESNDVNKESAFSLTEVSQKILEARHSARQSLEKQAGKMLKHSNTKFGLFYKNRPKC